jgi:hypothetical protein
MGKKKGGGATDRESEYKGGMCAGEEGGRGGRAGQVILVDCWPGPADGGSEVLSFTPHKNGPTHMIHSAVGLCCLHQNSLTQSSEFVRHPVYHRLGCYLDVTSDQSSDQSIYFLRRRMKPPSVTRRVVMPPLPKKERPPSSALYPISLGSPPPPPLDIIYTCVCVCTYTFIRQATLFATPCLILQTCTCLYINKYNIYI